VGKTPHEHQEPVEGAAVDENPIGILVGEQLSEVAVVVSDYVQLRFDGPTLTAIADPIVQVSGDTKHWGEPGYFDRLCTRGGHIVTVARVDPTEGILIGLDDGSTIRVSFVDEPRYTSQPEAATFSRTGELWVWPFVNSITS
jgi:hypothetical protein